MINIITSGSTSGNTNLNVHIFIDESGNVTQTLKNPKNRLKYYIDQNIPQTIILEDCAIGINDEVFGPCSIGTALGIGDTVIAFATYSANYSTNSTITTTVM